MFTLGDEKAQITQARIDETYRSGLKLMKAGKYDDAERYFKAVLKVSPNHGNSRFQLTQLKDLRTHAKMNLSQNQLKGINIKQVSFDAAPLNEVIEGLKILIDQENGEEKDAPNIVIQDPHQKIRNKEITLSLNNVPATTALQYILDLAAARVVHSEHIITVRPL